MMKKRAFAILLLCMTFVFSACQYTEDTARQEKQEFPISPLADAGSGFAKNVTLYFGYQEEDFLSTETRTLRMPLDERPEAYIIRQLIEGPSVTYADLRGLFNETVRVISVESADRMLIVTLSEDFLQAPSDAPANWQIEEEWVDKVRRRNRLALYSMVNTITDLGEYDRLQLQVETADDTTGNTARRIKMSDVGLAPDGQENNMLGAMGRAYDEVLSPKRAVDIVMNAWSRQDWERMYAYIASADMEGNPRPLRDDVASQLSASPISVINHAVLHTSISADGTTATVSLDLEYRHDGANDLLQNTVLKLIRENEAWKMQYSSLDALSKTQG